MQTTLALVVDDDPLIRQLYADLLGQHGYRVLTAQNAREAIDSVIREPVDIVLMDIMLPDMTGLEAMEVIREKAPQTPVIVVTAYATTEHAIRALKLGAYDFLPKGFRQEELVKAVHRAAERRKLMLENKRLVRGLHEKVQELSSLVRVGQTLNSTLKLDDLLGLVMQEAQKVLKAEASSLMLVDEQTNELYFTVALGDMGGTLKEIRLKLGQGIAGWVAQRGEPLVVPDVQNDPRFYGGLDERTGFRTKSILCVPIKVRGRTIGVIEVINRLDGGAFGEKDLPLLILVAAQAGIAIENARLYGETARQNTELSFLLQSSEDLLSVLDVETVFFRITAKLLETIPAARAGIITLENREAGRVVARAIDSQRLPPERCTTGKIPLALYPEIREVVRTRRLLVIPDVLTEPLMAEVRHLIEPIGLRSLLVVPMMDQDGVFGVMVVAHFFQPRAFSSAEIRLCQTLANQASVAMANARLYQELRQKGEELERASRNKSEFFTNMSHELRTPLTGILGFSEFLLDQSVGPLTEKQACYLENIHKSGQHLLQVINDLLDLSKAEAGKIILQSEPLSVAATLDDVLVIARGMAQKKDQTLEVQVAPDLPLLEADPVRFKQILINLVSNAIKFTPERGTIKIEARCVNVSNGFRMGIPHPISQSGDEPILHARQFLEVAVRDTGIGISAEDFPRLFQPFVQLEADQAQRGEGTGLGLALTRRLVELHGGRIRATSEGEGRGSTFTVILPLAPPDVPSEVSSSLATA